MPADHFGEPWPRATYKGFAGAPGLGSRRRGRWRSPRAALIGGLAATAVALGLVAGLALRPDRSALSADPEASVAQPMPIHVNAPRPPAPVPRPPGKLEVLSPATAEAVRAVQPARSTAAPAAMPLRPGRLDACAGAQSRSEALICTDPELAADDRELAVAYGRAMRSGAVAPDDLRADQRDWMDDRERAARRSPESMADIYRQRIEELNRIADDGPG